MHSSTGLCDYVRCLSILEYMDYIFYDPGWPSSAIPLLTTRLSNVTILKLDLHWKFLDDAAQAAMLSGFQRVTRLHMHQCIFETSAIMTKFIASFPSLADLSVAQFSAYAESVIPLPHTLNSISLSPSHSTFIDRLLHLEPHPDVRTINFPYMFEGFTKEMGQLLKTLGSCLENLLMGKFLNCVPFQSR
jgi:hypothetical protein